MAGKKARREDLRGSGHEILSVAGMYAADRHAMEHGVSGPALMERAGAAVAEAAAEARAEKGRVLVLAGPGNNGGDGYVAARRLAAEGHEVTVAALLPPERLRGDAAAAAARWRGEVKPLEALVAAGEDALGCADVVIDALFGAGLDRPLAGTAAAAATLLARARRRGRPRVVAVDVPSGLHGDTGRAPKGGVVIPADVTVTFFRRKPAHLLCPGRELCGRVVVADIGIPDSALHEVPAVALANDVSLWRHLLPRLPGDVHKYRRGSLVVVSGGPLQTGAARLAALAGLRAGAGVVTLAGEREALLVHAAQVTEIMLAPAESGGQLAEVLAERRAGAVVIGPAAGTGARTREMVLTLLRDVPDVAVVLDADVFTVFADAPEELFAAVAGRSGAVVMTPHEGEFARLFPDLAADLEEAPGKHERAEAAAARAGCTVLLKGPDTVIANAAGQVVIEGHGPPWLATAGSGDVLAGLIGGLLARGMPPLSAAAAAAWAHAEAARRAGPSLIASDLIPRAGELLAALAG
jgi:hydroxyethylthiazole kinase-like uncharacterized protein yjeF